jgi:carbonic anhydrase
MKHSSVNKYHFLLLSLALLFGLHFLPAAAEKSNIQSSETNHKNKDHLSWAQEHVLHADEIYAEHFGDKGDLTIYSKDKFVILTCMDARIDPAKFAGLAEGDAYIIRNAGAKSSDDALRSLSVASKLLGIKEIFVIAHTDCAMETFTDVVMRKLFKSSLGPAKRDSNGKWHNISHGKGSTEALYVDWLTINSGLKNSVVADVRRIRDYALISKKIAIYGYIYDVHTGKLSPVHEAMKIGEPQK